MAQAISKMETVQTAVEWLNENNITVCEMLLINKISETQYEQLINCFSMNLEQAKSMEKEQSINDYKHGQNNGYMYRDGVGNIIDAEKYYNQTYGS